MQKIFSFLKKNSHRFSEYFLVIGLLTIFGVFGFQKIIEPSLWSSYMNFLHGMFGIELNNWVKIVGVVEISSAGLLIFRKTRIVGTLIIILQLLVILYIVKFSFNGSISALWMRDFAILLMAFGLFFHNFGEK